MKRIQELKPGTVLVLAAFVAATWAHGAFAADSNAASSNAASSSTGSAVSGGVSLNSRDALRSNTPPHNVKMVFALNTGNYVSDVGVKVTRSGGGTVIDEVSNGPWFFLQLPPGAYVATATYYGKSVSHRFNVGKKGVSTAQFRWPASVEKGAESAAAAEGGGQVLGTGPQEPQQR